MRVGRKLKKNNVAVDVVAFGSEDVNGEKLEALIEAVNSGDNSHLVTVPSGTILSDMLFTTPIFQARRFHKNFYESFPFCVIQQCSLPRG